MSLKPKRLLVLCYGNIYRSPFVEAYLKTNIRDNLDLDICSAGFFPKQGRKSSGDYIELAKAYKIDLSHHKSTVVDDELIRWADAIFIMDGKNYKLSLMLDPGAEKKIIWLGSLNSNDNVEIQDPYNKTKEEQIKIIEQMITSCNRCIKYFT